MKLVKRRVLKRDSNKMTSNKLAMATSLKMPLVLVVSCMLVFLLCNINHVVAEELSTQPKSPSLFDSEATKLALASNEAATDMMLKAIIGGPMLNSQFVDELDGAETNAQYGERGLPQIDRAAAQELAALHDQLSNRNDDDELLDGSSAKSPPVYKSAPQQIVDVGQVVDSGKAAPVGRSERDADMYRGSAGQHRSSKSGGHKRAAPKQKPKKKKAKKPKKKVKKVVKKVVKKSVKKVVKEKKKQPKKKKKSVETHSPYSGPSHYSEPNGDYYEYRSVPSKGAWDFGFKRGNPEHTVQRKEHGDKSHFKTEVKWQDKKGEGHHLFDYNHYNKKHHPHHDGHHAAAASKPNVAAKKPKQQEAQLYAKEVDLPAIQHQH